MPTSRFHVSADNILLFGMVSLLCMMLGACSMFEESEFEPFDVERLPAVVLEKYKDTDQCKKRLSRLPAQQQIDSLLILTELLKSRDEESALIYAQQANGLAKFRNKPLSEAISLYYLGVLRGGQAYYEEGIVDPIVDAKMGVSLARQSENAFWQIRHNRLIGDLFFRRIRNENRFSDSSALYFDRGLSLLDQANLGEKDSLSLRAELLYGQLSQLLYTDTSKILPVYQECLTLYQLTGDIDGLVILQQFLGIYYERKKNFGRAERLYRKSITSALESKDNYLLPMAYLRLGNLKIKQYKAAKLGSGEQLFDEGMTLLYAALVEEKKKKYLAESAIGLAFQHRANKEKEVNSYDSAILHYVASVNSASEEGAFSTMQVNVNNIVRLCEYLDRREDGRNCEEIMGLAPNKFLNDSYVAIMIGANKDVEAANRRIQKFQREQVESSYTQKRRNQWMISIGILVLSGLVFLLLLQRSQKRRLIVRMEALRAQINPHFISNSLNAIESLVNMGKNEDASKYLIHFSRLTRRILNSSRTPKVSLAEEIKTLEHFLVLEQLRFRDKLRYEIQVDPIINPELVEVPAMIIQPYLENAIWHGIKPKKEPGFLLITIEKVGNQLVYTVEDDGIGREKSRELQAMRASVMKRKSLGMQITQERLRINNQQKGTQVDIVDLEDEEGIAAGTRVIVRLSYKLKKEKS